jgi:hypothetical protein
MAFSHAIYYPWIDIEDSEWLKTAILYWDKISTIVPGHLDQPYNSVDSAFLYQADILVPEFVQSGDPAVLEASNSFLVYLRTPEAETIILPRGRRIIRLPSINRTRDLAKLDRWKIGDHLYLALKESGNVLEEGHWLIFDRQSINYYMTLLAASLSLEKHFSPLTYDGSFEPMINRAKRGDNPKTKKQDLGEALLAQFTLETIKIAPDTPLEALITFRDDHKDEIALFRSELGSLAQTIDPETPSLDALQQQVYDIYTNKIHPAVHLLEKALTAKRIRTLVTHLSSIIFAESLSYFAPNTLYNLATFAGCQIIGNAINYGIDRQQALMDNPYSFILSARAELS